MHGDYSYVLSVWLLLFNAVSYASGVKYSQSHRLRFGSLIAILVFVVSTIVCCLVPMMACNDTS